MTEEREVPPAGAPAEEQIEQAAAEAVRRLGVDVVIEQASETILTQFEDCDRFASGSPADADAMFIALSLPITNALIHYATSRYQMADTKSWLRREWPDLADAQDPTSTLAVLTLLHIVSEGWRRYRNQPEKKEVWARIRKRVEKFIPGPRSAAA